MRRRSAPMRSLSRTGCGRAWPTLLCSRYTFAMLAGSPRELSDLLAKAFDKRAELIARDDLDAYRLLHGRVDGIEGLGIERLGPVLVVQLHQDRLRLSEAQVRSAAMFFHERLGTR